MSAQRSTLLGLPAELIVQICHIISASDVTRLRRTCRRVRDVVDSNAEHISSRIRARELTRLREFTSYYVIYEGNVSFVEAFSRWARLRGWADANNHHNYAANDVSVEAFAKHWTPLKTYPDLSQQAYAVSKALARMLWHVYDTSRNPHRYNDLPVTSAENLISSFRELARGTASYTDAELIAMHAEVITCRTAGGRLAGPEREAYRTDQGTAAFRDLIHAPSIEERTLVRTINPVSFNRWVPGLYITEICGVPKLPWTNHFAYVVETDWANYVVNELLQLHREGKAIDPLLLAAGLEQLRIW